MTDIRFEKFWPRLMKYEGGAELVNNPSDPGGKTRYGISQRAYPKLNIDLLTEDDAKQLTFNDYYSKMRIADVYDDRVAWQLFDFGFNAGMNKAVRILQGIVGTIPDGVMGVKTLNKVNAWQDEYPLHVHYVGRRVMYYFALTERNPGLYKFLKGWINRTLEL